MVEQRDRNEFGTGHSHGFIPLEPVDLSKVEDADDLLKSMSKTAFGGRRLGEAADIFYNMITDPDCFTVITLSGAMTVAKMGLIITDMIDQNMVQAVVSTGALITHGLVEHSGMTHFKYDFSKSDHELEQLGYDRVYDTLELEKNLDDLEKILNEGVFNKINPNEVLCSRILCKKIGEHLINTTEGRGILKSAFKNNVPIYIPAFTDCELGLDFGLFNRKRVIAGDKAVQFDPFLDLDHFADLILKQNKLGIFTIGGGVPRNWAQQVGPYLDFIRFSIRDKEDRDKYHPAKDDPYNKAYKYAVRICPEPVEWGGLSGCTYSEGVTWGKFWDQKKEGGQFAEVLTDATYVWPLLIKGIQDRLKKNNVTIKKNFSNEEIL